MISTISSDDAARNGEDKRGAGGAAGLARAGVVHELFEHVDGRSGVGVPLGVAVAKRIWGDQGRVKRDRPTGRASCPRSIQAAAHRLVGTSGSSCWQRT